MVALLGPTASGKTALATRLARELPLEVVSADSALVYRGLRVGTARPSSQELARVRHHLIDVCELSESFSLADFQRLAQQAVQDIHARGKLPLIVGGTGLYVRGLLQGYALSEAAPNPELRARLSARPLPELVEELRRLDPDTRVDLANPRRVIRALEVCLTTGRPFSAFNRTADSGLDALQLGLRWSRQELDERIRERTRQMLADGLLEEVRALVEKGHSPHLRRLKLIGYEEMLDVVEGGSLTEAVERLERNTRRYARRQLTWLGREKEIHWLEAPSGLWPRALEATRQFLKERKETEPC